MSESSPLLYHWRGELLRFPEVYNLIPVSYLKNNLLVLKESLFPVNFLMENSVKIMT